MAWKNEDRYEGDFLASKRHGKGQMYFCNGDNYDGNFINNEMEGQGIYTWKSGERYQGLFHKGVYQEG